MVNPNNQTNQEELKKNSLTSQSKSTLWVPSNMKWAMVNLIQKSRLQNKTEDLQKIILQRRWTQEILTTSPCLGKTGVSSVINDVKKELNLEYKEYDHISDEDIELGLELYSYLHYCQRGVVESAELSVFFEMLLTNHSLETLVASTMNNLQPRVGENVKDLAAMNLWFKELENKLNLSLGSLLVSLFSTTDLIKLDQLEPPFLGRNKSSFTLCLFENDCGDLLQVPGMFFNTEKNDLNRTKLDRNNVKNTTNLVQSKATACIKQVILFTLLKVENSRSPPPSSPSVATNQT